MGLGTLIEEKREDILRIAAQHGARDVRVFGSVARGEANAESDIDVSGGNGTWAEPVGPRSLVP